MSLSQPRGAEAHGDAEGGVCGDCASHGGAKKKVTVSWIHCLVCPPFTCPPCIPCDKDLAEVSPRGSVCGFHLRIGTQWHLVVPDLAAHTPGRWRPRLVPSSKDRWRRTAAPLCGWWLSVTPWRRGATCHDACRAGLEARCQEDYFSVSPGIPSLSGA